MKEKFKVNERFEQVGLCAEHGGFVVYIPETKSYWCLDGGEEIDIRTDVAWLIGKVTDYEQ